MVSEQASAAVAVLRQRGVTTPIRFGLVAGTGLAGIGEAMTDAIAVPYADLPGFPPAGVSGHAGRLVVGRWDGTPIAVLGGRAHYYEAGDAGVMRVPLETLKALGAEAVLLTNSAGSLDRDWPPGTLALIADHINLSGTNPLIGTAGDGRFVNLAEAYDLSLRAQMREAAATAGIALKEGVYMWLSGPSFETPAEIRMCRMLGADLVGMSTVPETILARHLGLRVLGLSVVTNFGTGLEHASPSHAETKAIALSAAAALQRLIGAFFRAQRDARG